MELNIESKKELRKRVLELLEQVPEGTKIKLDSETLDELIFDKKTSPDSNVVVKFPKFTGYFLRKLDLSELSLDGTYWYVDDKIIDFSYTDIKVDFLQASNIVIRGCSFEGVDLSNSNIDCVKSIRQTNLTNTKFPLKQDNKICFSEVNFSHNDFSDLSFNLSSVLGIAQNYSMRNFKMCNFYDTKINFTYDEEKDKNIFFVPPNPNPHDGYYTYDWARNEFKSMLKNGYLDGCYINGILVDSNNIDMNQGVDSILERFKPKEEKKVQPIIIEHEKIDMIVNCITDCIAKSVKDSVTKESEETSNAPYNDHNENINKTLEEGINGKVETTQYSVNEQFNADNQYSDYVQVDTDATSSKRKGSTFNDELNKLIDDIASDLDIDPKKVEKGRAFIKSIFGKK